MTAQETTGEEKPGLRLEAVVEPSFAQAAEGEQEVNKVEELGKISHVPVEEQLRPVEPIKVGDGGGGWWLGLGGLVLGVVVGVALGFAIWGGTDRKRNKSEEVVIPTPAVKKQAAATATPAVSEKKEEIKVQVLNGTGVRGAAATTKTYLEGLGYRSVVTGNADRDDYAATEVKAKKESITRLVLDDVKKKYTNIASEAGVLAEDSEYDAVVIIGKE